MKVAQVRYAGVNTWGLVQGSKLRLAGTQSTKTPLQVGPECDWTCHSIRRQLTDGVDHLVDWNAVQFLAPVSHPQKIICVGRNYAEHAAEMGSAVQELPVIFNKFSTAISGPDSEVVLPRISDRVDFEAELVVVIGKPGANIPLKKALDHVFGYCCGNDVSARDWQKGKPGGQWLLGKTFDGFAPIGPWIVTADELDPRDLEIRLYLNGQLMQADRTSNLIFPIDYLISHVSQFCTLQAGDLLFTGTPAGVGAGRQPQVFLQPGDETMVEIAGIGQLRNKYVAAAGGLQR